MDTEIAIIGAGPAGLAAAAEATRAGASVTVIDEYGGPGGQYFRARRPGRADPGRIAPRVHTLKQQVLHEIDSSRVRYFYETAVWGVFSGNVLVLSRDGASQSLKFQRLVVATGAYDRPVAFPGWTLPGVMTAGGAQALVKAYGVLPGRRVMLAGSGPFLLPVAEELAAAGTTVVAVLEATRPHQWIRHLSVMWKHRGRLEEAYRYVQSLRQAHVSIRFGRVIKEARGADVVEEVTTVAVDAEWHPIPRTERREAVDAVCIGYGFLPATELTRQAGCGHHFDPLRGGWLPTHDAEMRTTVPAIFVAGEAAGVGGASVALLEGRIAGLAAARDLGRLSAAEAASRLRRSQAALAPQRTFADVVLRMFQVRPGILDLVTADTLICRCEEVPAARLAECAAEWPADLKTCKGIARPGMGLCQGRICGHIMAGLVARQAGRPEQELGMLSARPPVKPVAMAALGMLDVEAEEYVVMTADQMRMIARSGE